MTCTDKLKRLAASAVVAVAVLGSTALTYAAPAADKWVFVEGGYRCEGHLEGSLGKVVCRNPQNFDDYYVMFFDFDHGRSVVFMDSFTPVAAGRVTLRQEQMSFAEFSRRYDR
jgi:hypothetical protein